MFQELVYSPNVIMPAGKSAVYVRTYVHNCACWKLRRITNNYEQSTNNHTQSTNYYEQITKIYKVQIHA